MDERDNLVRTLVNAGKVLAWDKLQILRTTAAIFKDHFRFGQQILAMKDPVQSALRYDLEVLAVLVVVWNAIGGRLTVHLLPAFPFSEELEAILYALATAATGVCVYAAERLLTGRVIPATETVAAYLYWWGFYYALSIVIALLSAPWGLDAPDYIAVPAALCLLSTYLLLLQWIAEIHQTSMVGAFISFWAGVVLFYYAGHAVLYVLKIPFDLLDINFPINPEPS